jgi:hypothetical protein
MLICSYARVNGFALIIDLILPFVSCFMFSAGVQPGGATEPHDVNAPLRVVSSDHIPEQRPGGDGWIDR